MFTYFNHLKVCYGMVSQNVLDMQINVIIHFLH